MNLTRRSRYVLAFPVRDKYVLVNCLTGVVRFMSCESAQHFFDGEVTPEVKPFFTSFTMDEEREKARSLCEFMRKTVTKCADGNIALTLDCNLKCPYCFEIWAKSPEKRITVDEYKVDKAFEALEFLNKECEERSVGITGGEPLMKKNESIVKYLLKKGDDLGYRFFITTNGIELDHFLPLLSSVDIEYIQVTIDGPPSLHDRRRVFRKGEGTFSTIVKNVEEGRKLGLPFAIRTNTDPEVLSCIDELAAIFKDLGWTDDPTVTFSLNALYEQHVSPEKVLEYVNLYEKALDIAKRPELSFVGIHDFIRHFRRLRPLSRDPPRFWPSFWYCAAMSRRYVFDPFGDVYPCPMMVGWGEERIGVYVPELVFNEKHTQWQNRTIFSMKKCESCPIALVCGGECGYASLLREKDLYTPVCTTTEKLILDYLEYCLGEKAERF